MRAAALIWAFLYFFSAVGYGAKVHYCLGQVSEVSFIWFDASCSCEDAATHVKREMSCCDEDSFFVQLEDDHQQSLSVEVAPGSAQLLAVIPVFNDEPIHQEYLLDADDRAPPSPKERLISLQRLVFYA